MKYHRSARVLHIVLTLVVLGLPGCLGRRSSTPIVLESSILNTVSQIGNEKTIGYHRINDPDPSDLMNVAIFELDNGLKVYLTENHEEPRFHAEIVVRVGGKHDPVDATGLAHYLEHLLFKGTKELGTTDYQTEKVHLERITQLYEEHFVETDLEKRATIYSQINAESQLAAKYAIPNELDKLYQSMGASLKNAGTGNELTTYMINLPANRLEQWAKIESHRLYGEPIFRLFHSELEVVYEEKNRALDSKDRLIRDAVYEKVYKNHPYRRSILGTVDHLKNPSLTKIYDFFNTYYVPNNMAICLSGHIDITETIRIIAENFGSWQPKPIPKPTTWVEEPIDEIERVKVQYEGEEYVMVVFRTVPQNHDDVAALSLCDMILDNATAGLINLNLNQQQKLRQAGSRPSFKNDYGSQELWGIPKKDQSLEEVEKLLLEQIDLIKHGDFEDWIIPAIVNDFKKSEKSGLEDNYRRVSALRSAFIADQDWSYAVRSIERMEKLTKDDVVAVANKYFGDNYVVGYRIDDQHQLPQVDKPKIDPIQIDSSQQSEFAKSVLEMPTVDIEPTFIEPERDYQTIDHYPGVKLYYTPNPVNDLFQLSFTFDVGKLHHPKLGIAALLLDKSGTFNFSASDLKEEWYKLGSDFNFSVAEQSSTLTISGMDENFGATLALALSLIKQPKVDQSTLKELIEIVLANREDAKKNYQSIAQAMAEYNLYGDKSARLRLLSNEDVRELTVGELTKSILDLFSYQHNISYVGTLSLPQLRSQLNSCNPLEGVLSEPPEYEFFVPRQSEESEIYLFDKEIAQAYVRLDFGGGVYDEAERSTINLYNEYFDGGMSGVVFQELREARALAYASYARYATGKRKGDVNRMVALVLCQADKTAEALEAFVNLIDDLPVSDERFKIAKSAIINRYKTAKVGFRDVIGAVRSWEYQQLDIDPRRDRYQETLQSNLDLLLDFHQDSVKGRKKLISIVGDTSKMDLESLSKHGKITRISLEQIFPF